MSMKRLVGFLLLIIGMSFAEGAKHGASRRTDWVPREVLKARRPDRGRSHQGTELQGGSLEGSVVRGAIDSDPERRVGNTVLEGFRFGERPFPVKVAAEMADPCRPPEAGVKLYQLEVHGENPCEGLTLGGAAALSECEREHLEAYRGKAVAVTGGWGERMRFVPATPRQPFSTFSCLSGVIAKCTRLGYRSWAGPELTEMLQTCLRAARADYCGTGTPHTCSNAVMDMADRYGIQRREPSPGDLLEADWTPDGAVCLERPRLPGCSEAQLEGLREAIRKECEAQHHPIRIGGCMTSCAAGDETCGHLMRTWTVPGQMLRCEASQAYCPASW
jgi:hypothetical protein